MFTTGKRILVEPIDEYRKDSALIGGDEISRYKTLAVGNDVDERIKEGTILYLNKKLVVTFKIDDKKYYISNVDNVIMFDVEGN